MACMREMAQWRERFNEAWPKLATGKFDARFKRMWELYLAYCEGDWAAESLMSNRCS